MSKVSIGMKPGLLGVVYSNCHTMAAPKMSLLCKTTTDMKCIRLPVRYWLFRAIYQSTLPSVHAPKAIDRDVVSVSTSRSRDSFAQRLGLVSVSEKCGNVSVSVSSRTESQTSRSRLGLGPQGLVYK